MAYDFRPSLVEGLVDGYTTEAQASVTAEQWASMDWKERMERTAAVSEAYQEDAERMILAELGQEPTREQAHELVAEARDSVGDEQWLSMSAGDRAELIVSVIRARRPVAAMPRTFWKEKEHQDRLAAVIETAKRDGVLTLSLTADEADQLNIVATAGYRALRDDAPQEARDTVLAVLNLLDIGIKVLHGEGEEA